MSNEKETWLFWVYRGLYYPFFLGILRNHYEHQDFMKSKAGWLSWLRWYVMISFEILNPSCLPPGKLTWNLKITCLKRKIKIIQTFTTVFHVHCQGCNQGFRGQGLLLGANQPGWQRATPAPLSKAAINEKPSSSVEFHLYILYNSTSGAVAMNSLFHIIYIYVVFSNIHIMIFFLILW